jgi:hypothetical protein
MAVLRGADMGRNVYRVMAREHGCERDRKERARRSSEDYLLAVSDYSYSNPRRPVDIVF